MNRFLASRLFDGTQFKNEVEFVFDNGKLHFESHPAGSEVTRLEGITAPGFIDVQVNGGGGGFLNADPHCLV